MELRYLIFQTVKSLSLIAWYLDSPQTANFGRTLADCPDFSIACLHAGQNALRVYHEQKIKMENCKRLQRIAELDTEREREQREHDRSREAENVLATFKELGSTFNPTFNFVTVNLHLSDKLHSEDPLEIAKQHCANLDNALIIDAPMTVSLQTTPPSIDASKTYPQSNIHWKALMEEDFGNYSDMNLANLPESRLVSVLVTAILLLGLAVVILDIYLMICYTCGRLWTFCRRLFDPLQSNQFAQANRDTQLPQPAETASSYQLKQVDRTADAEHAGQVSPPDQACLPLKADQTVQSHQRAQKDSSAYLKQVSQTDQGTPSEAPDTVPAGMTIIDKSELERLKQQANYMRGQINATKQLSEAIERVR
jgi:hypothetical protein